MSAWFENGGATAGLSSSAEFNYTERMERSPLHRKKVRHFNEPNQFHELTFSCYKRLPLLTNNAWRFMLTDSVDRAMQRHGYLLTAFVYMPEHVHLLIFPQDTASRIDELLKAIKRPFSYRIKRLLTETGSPLLGQLTVRQRPGVSVFRFWQEGPGYDRNLTSMETALAATTYIHLNPVRRRIVESELDWRWSSARHYIEPQIEPDPALPSITPLSEIVFV
jgi:putative transposase